MATVERTMAIPLILAKYGQLAKITEQNKQLMSKDIVLEILDSGNKPVPFSIVYTERMDRETESLVATITCEVEPNV